MGNFFSDVGDTLFGSTEQLKPSDIRSPEQQRVFNDLLTQSGARAGEFFETAGQAFP